MKISDITTSFGRSRHPDKDNDLGFGTGMTASGERLINRNGSFNIERRGLGAWRPYQTLVEMDWLPFFGIVILFYIVINIFFAVLFVIAGTDSLQGVGLSGSLYKDFIAAFFFSVQTFTTVGYGAISPIGAAANIIAAFDALVGLMTFALATGLFFARFSKPKASLLFSDKAVFRPYKDTPYNSFQFQLVNQRNNKIINLQAKVSMTWVEQLNGNRARRFAMLELERAQIFLFPLNWVVVHIINKESPLWGRSEEEVREMKPEFIILIQGYDETFAQDVHANGSYTCNEVFWNMRFEKMYYPGEDGKTILELERVHQIVPLVSEEEE